MIWFQCKKCGRKHGKPDNAAGQLIFCECSFGNRVPYQSTIPEPADLPAQRAPAPRRAAPPPAPRPKPVYDLEDAEPDPPPRPAFDDPPPKRPPREPRRVNPKLCLNHGDRDAELACAACGMRFCPSCVVTFQGETVCGVCKNFRTRGMQRPPRVAPWAVAAAVIALAGTPVSFCAGLMAVGTAAHPQGHAGQSLFFGLLSLLLPAVSVVLAGRAVREVDSRPDVSGRGLAVTGAAAGLVGVVWSAAVVGLILYKAFEA